MVLHAHDTRGSPPRGGGGRSPHLGGRGRRLAAALLCALLAAVTVAVESPGQPAGAAASDQSGGSQDPPAAPTTSAAAPTTSAVPQAAPAKPAVPSRFTASFSLVGGSVSLGWDNPGDATITKYQYRIRDVDAGGDYGDAWTDIPGSGVSTTSATIAVTGKGRRNVQLRAVNAGGSGSHAVASTDVPAAPSRLRASLAGSSVSLSWDDPGDGSIDSYWYRIKKAGAGNAYSLPIEISGSGASTTSATISVTGEGRRIVELQARPAIHPGWGARYKSAVASTGPPAAPDASRFSTSDGSVAAHEYNELNAPAGSPKGAIVVNWVAPGDDSILKYQYKFRAQSRPGSYSQWIDIPDSGALTTTYTFVFPTPEMYRVRLRAVNNAGVGGVTSFNMRPAWPALAVPSGLSASLSGSSVSLSWDNPFDGSVYKYQYRIKTVGAANTYSSWADVAGSNSDTTSATISVTGSERRIVQLRAHRRSLGSPSSPATASTGLPAAPDASRFSTSDGSVAAHEYNELNAPAGSPKGAIVVNWVAPGDDSILKYQYKFRAQSRPGSYSQWIDIPDSGALTTTYTFVFPTPEMYRVRLRAVNNAGVGGVTSFNMRPAWPALAVPSGLSASLSGSSVSLSWDNPFDGSVYKYQYRIKTASAVWTDKVKWLDIAGSNADTTSATITITGSERRTVQLRALRRSLGSSSPAATASTE